MNKKSEVCSGPNKNKFYSFCIKTTILAIILSISLLQNDLYAVEFIGKKGIIKIADIADWTIKKDLTDRKKGKLSLKLTGENIHFEITTFISKPAFDIMNPAFTKTIKEKFEKSGMEVVSDAETTFCGEKAYRVNAVKRAKKKNRIIIVNAVSYSFFKGDQFVAISVAGEKMNADLHPKVVALLNNIKILAK